MIRQLPRPRVAVIANSQLAVPNPYLHQGPRVIKLDIGPGVASGAKKIASLALIIPS
jgi:hypothetical protein